MCRNVAMSGAKKWRVAQHLEGNCGDLSKTETLYTGADFTLGRLIIGNISAGDDNVALVNANDHNFGRASFYTQAIRVEWTAECDSRRRPAVDRKPLFEILGN